MLDIWPFLEDCALGLKSLSIVSGGGISKFFICGSGDRTRGESKLMYSLFTFSCFFDYRCFSKLCDPTLVRASLRFSYEALSRIAMLLKAAVGPTDDRVSVKD